MPLRSSGSCGTYLVYSPRGLGPKGSKSKEVCYGLKNGHVKWIRKTARHIKEHRRVKGVRGILGPDAALVPMPRSSPVVTGGLWPAKLLAQALVKVDLGERVLELLERTAAVRRSSTAPKGKRPAPQQHFDSFVVKPLGIYEPEQIVVVDDVVTSGATMLAALSRLMDAFPDVPISGFAFVRTMSDSPIDKIPVPALCSIRLSGNRAIRFP